MFRSLCFAISSFILLSYGVGSFQATTRADEPATSQAVAVVELFTSQGCSSCPPADDILTKLHAWGEKNGQPVYCLSFHVDYWNSLGWADPFSRPEFTARQREYAQSFQTTRIYTPQMIVNGDTEFVGSRGSEAMQALKAALKSQVGTTIHLQATMGSDGRTGTVRYKVAVDQPTAVLNIALVQNEVENSVPRGENAGRDLAHVNVVRALQSVSLDKPSGRVELTLPQGLPASSARVIAYVQHRQSRQVLGATAVDFVSDQSDRLGR